ncbi:MAG TPA: hypothetical protein VFC00_33100, partial [Micromonosporaceae bacterium]|nr:hypothetical protein [Micromonosporaceae bacterium]
MLTDEPLEPGQWRRFVEPAAVLWLVAGAGAIRWGRLDLCQNLRDAAAGQVLENIAALALLTAAGVIVVDLLAWAVRQVWLGRAVPWPLSTLLLRRRRRRWHAAGHGIDPAADPEAVQRFARRRTRIALTEPQSPTWIGDRIMAASTRVRNAYGLDLPSAWPRLWLLLPDAGRAELRR